MQSFTLKIDKIIDAIWASLRLIIDPVAAGFFRGPCRELLPRERPV